MRLTATHEEQVAYYVVHIARQLGLPAESVGELQLAALIHDIGKVCIPEHIIYKPGRLTDDEHAVVKGHTVIGWKIVQFSGLEHTAGLVRHHHERWDGKGYPDGLEGKNIPLGSRIIFVADSFDALTSDRPYRKGWPRVEAVEEIQAHAGTQFDPAVVKAFAAIEESGDGLMVMPVPRPV